MGINEIVDLETISSKDTMMHNLEGRIKLISILLIIIFCVFSNRLIVPVVLEFMLSWAASFQGEF